MALFSAMRLVDDGDEEIAWIVDRESANEGGEQRLVRVAVPRDLFRGAGLAADQISRRRRKRAGALLDNEAHQAPHVFRGAWRHDLLTSRNIAGGRLNDRRGAQHTTIDD